jgi:hypothetical protein
MVSIFLTHPVHKNLAVDNLGAGHLVVDKAALLLANEPEQGCQMVYFQTKNPHLVKFFEGRGI